MSILTTGRNMNDFGSTLRKLQTKQVQFTARSHNMDNSLDGSLNEREIPDFDPKENTMIAQFN